jgi:hypothetical protein
LKILIVPAWNVLGTPHDHHHHHHLGPLLVISLTLQFLCLSGYLWESCGASWSGVQSWNQIPPLLFINNE